MPSNALVTLTVASLLAVTGLAHGAHAQCLSARMAADATSLPHPWRLAAEALIRSSVEPGHPWSCAGGTIALKLDAQGALLSIARQGEEASQRRVASPDEVLPLGQALLALPLAPQGAAEDVPPSAVEAVAAPPAAPPLPAASPLVASTEAPLITSTPARPLLLAAGVDARWVGGSNAGWIGPTLSAALRLGRWQPSISLRQQSAFASDGPGIDEWSVALAVQRWFPLSMFELRTGLALRGAVVTRDLPRPRGEQSRLEARVGLMAALVIPVVEWGRFVLSADGEVVGLSQATTQLDTAAGEQTPTSFPKFTLGGSACLEVSL